jgi:hypothetical protein
MKHAKKYRIAKRKGQKLQPRPRRASACATWGAEVDALSLAARTLALSALAPSGTGTIGSGPMAVVVRETVSINPRMM